MDFSFTDDQIELRSLAAKILADRCTPEHLRATAETESGTDLDLWRTMAEAGLISIGWTEAAGGGGTGWLGASIVLEEIGRHAAPVPAFATIALAGPAIAEAAVTASGHDGTNLQLIADAVAAGESVVTAAIHETGGDLFVPTVSSSGRTGSAARSRTCPTVRWHHTPSSPPAMGCGSSPSTTRQSQSFGRTRRRRCPTPRITFESRAGDPPRRQRCSRTRSSYAGCRVRRSSLQECAPPPSISPRPTRRAREQFGKPIASLQAVSQRAADAYIDTEAVRLTAWHAASLIDVGADALETVLTAKFWAAEAGWRVIHAAHHLHGGFGVDRDYPLHRYYLLMQHLELQLGSATPSLVALGAQLARA